MVDKSTELALENPTFLVDHDRIKNSSKHPPNRIRELREDRSLTQEQLAEMIGTSNQQVGRLENSERRLTWEWMQRIANALACHPIDLVEESPKSTTAEEQKLLETYRILSREEKKTVASMADYLAEKTAPSFKPKKKS